MASAGDSGIVDGARDLGSLFGAVWDKVFGVELAPGTPTLGGAPTHDYLYDPHPDADNSAYDFARGRAEGLREWGGYVQQGVGYVEDFYLTVGASVILPGGLHSGKQGKHIPGHNNSMPGKTQFPVGTTMDDVVAIYEKAGGAGNRKTLLPGERARVVVDGVEYAISWAKDGSWHMWPLGR